MPFPLFTADELRDLHRRYMAGESSVEIAHALGCHSSTLRKRWGDLGLEVRDGSASMLLRMAKTSAEERARLTAAAHDAVRGRRPSAEAGVRRAVTCERLGLHIGAAERDVAATLQRRGLAVVPQYAVGPYNVDVLAAGSVAVEVFGGGWHSTGRHASRHSERVRYLLDADLHVVIVWVDNRRGRGWVRGLEEVVALADLARRDPASVRQYRVVWSDGNLVISLDAHADDFPAKPAFRVRRNTSGRYERAG